MEPPAWYFREQTAVAGVMRAIKCLTLPAQSTSDKTRQSNGTPCMVFQGTNCCCWCHAGNEVFGSYSTELSHVVMKLICSLLHGASEKELLLLVSCKQRDA
jgi:hypothetical protein